LLIRSGSDAAFTPKPILAIPQAMQFKGEVPARLSPVNYKRGER